jgi:GTP-binding protein LepA
VEEVLEAIVERLPPRRAIPSAPLKALIFDSWYDPYQGVVTLFRVMDGTIKKGDIVKFFS